MKAIISKASDWKFKKTCEIASLEDLIHLMETERSAVIVETYYEIDKNADSLDTTIASKKRVLHIRIYDDYIE